uniref:Acid phosphatase n=1 Tax=Ditylenchus dipsaci TaxID=166011 RepID=A0A915DQ32_9BILA
MYVTRGRMQGTSLLCFLLAGFHFHLAVGRELKFVQAIWRHGDRAPDRKMYSNDVYGEEYWPRGWNQLTNLGMLQMKELGQFMHDRYAGSFVSPSFNKTEVFVLSSEADRALVSAQALLNGFFPAMDQLSQFENNLPWQPIPVHSSGADDPDPLLKPTSFDCPKYDEVAKETLDKLAKEMRAKYSRFFTFIEQNAENGASMTFHNVAKLGGISREIIHNLSQPAWVHQTWPEYGNQTTLELLTEIRRAERISEFNSTKLAYLRGGFLLGDWLSRITKLAKGEPAEKPSKMMLYSSHDGTIQALLHSMRLNDGKQVPYSACIFMEVHQVDDGGWEVELFYRRNRVLERMTVVGCEEVCPVTKLMKLLKKRAIYKKKKLLQECGLNYNSCENNDSED